MYCLPALLTQTLQSSAPVCSDALMIQKKQEMEVKGFVQESQTVTLILWADYCASNAIPQYLAGKPKERHMSVGEAAGDSTLHLLLSPNLHFNSTTHCYYRSETQGLTGYMKWKVNNPINSNFFIIIMFCCKSHLKISANLGCCCNITCENVVDKQLLTKRKKKKK